LSTFFILAPFLKPRYAVELEVQ